MSMLRMLNVTTFFAWFLMAPAQLSIFFGSWFMSNSFLRRAPSYILQIANLYIRNCTLRCLGGSHCLPYIRVLPCPVLFSKKKKKKNINEEIIHSRLEATLLIEMLIFVVLVGRESHSVLIWNEDAWDFLGRDGGGELVIVLFVSYGMGAGRQVLSFCERERIIHVGDFFSFHFISRER